MLETTFLSFNSSQGYQIVKSFEEQRYVSFRVGECHHCGVFLYTKARLAQMGKQGKKSLDDLFTRAL